MIPGPPLGKECPHCGEVKALVTLISGNTFGAICWSDSKTFYPMLPSPSNVQKCSKCGKYYFLSDANTVPTDKDPYETPTIGELDFKEAKEALRQLYDSSDERNRFILRSYVLYAFNDLYGRNGSPYREDSEDYQYFVENCREMIKMSHTSSTFRAELYREIGEFEECLTYLDSLDPGSDVENEIREKIRQRAVNKDKIVFTLNDF